MSKFNKESDTISRVSHKSMNDSREENSNKFSKAKRVRFYHNGNQYFNGVVVPVSAERYRSFDSLTMDLTNILTNKVSLPQGVRTIYSLEGRKVTCIDDLEDGKAYVCSGKTDMFKKMNYGVLPVLKTWKTSTQTISVLDSSTSSNSSPTSVKPRFITVVRNGHRPRRVFRLFLNKRNASTMEQVLKALTDSAHLDTGAVRKIFTPSGQPVTTLEQIIGNTSEGVFFVYGNERHTLDDFKLTAQENNVVQSYQKGSRVPINIY